MIVVGRPVRGLARRSRHRSARSRIAQLARLRARIVRDLYLDTWREVWFFPPFEGVCGWQGTKDVIFVGLNPSTGHFPDAACRMLYRHLRRSGFNRAHLTDAIKERLTGAQVDDIAEDVGRMARYRRYLLREIAIIRPRLIVALGYRASKILTTWLPADLPIQRIPHYAARFPTAKTRRRGGAEMARIRREYARLKRRR